MTVQYKIIAYVNAIALDRGNDKLITLAQQEQREQALLNRLLFWVQGMT